MDTAEDSCLAALARLSPHTADPVAGTSLCDYSALAAVRALRAGTLRCTDYAAALLARAHQGQALNAFRCLEPGRVEAAAQAADLALRQGRPPGLLHGLPIPVKDSVDSADLPTSNGTAALRDFRPVEDAGLLKRLFTAGALLMGKTNLHELSYGWTSANPHFGAVRNPWDPNRIPGGSSGGSAAAVAAGMAPLSVAEDTQGSIRVPASMCGLAGLRPSFGRYPGSGLMALTLERFDQAGPLARSVADLLLFDAAMTGALTLPTVPALAAVRIGVCRGLMLRGLDPGTEACVEAALTRLARAGVTLVELDLRGLIVQALEVAMVLISRETRPAIAAYLERSATGIDFDQLLSEVGDEVRTTMLTLATDPGRPTVAAHRAALQQRGALVASLDGLFAQHRLDAIAYPSTLCPALQIGEDDEVQLGPQRVPFWVAMARNTSLGSCAGLASLVLPVGLTPQQLPVGLEFSALHGQDRALLGLGLALERELGRLPGPPAWTGGVPPAG